MHSPLILAWLAPVINALQTPPRKESSGRSGLGRLSTAWTLSKITWTSRSSMPQLGRAASCATASRRGAAGRRRQLGQHPLTPGHGKKYPLNIFQARHAIDAACMTSSMAWRRTQLTGFAEQGQYSPPGLQAIWPVYRDKQTLPTGLAQTRYTRFLKLSPLDLATAAPLVAAFSEFLSDDDAWRRYDELSFRDLCTEGFGVSRKPYRRRSSP